MISKLHKESAHDLLSPGPGGGKNGGKIIFQGNLTEMLKNGDTPTSNIFKKELNLS